MNQYNNFNNFILRTPTTNLKGLLKEDIDLSTFINNEPFLQAVNLASPTLYQEFIKWKDNKTINKKEEDRLLYSMLKYYVRSCMRCTPFGYFSGINIGKISTDTNIILNSEDSIKAHSRLDMNYLCSLIQDLEKDKEIRSQLTYYTNNSLYNIGEKIRYVEYTYSNSRREHQLSAVDNNRYLQKVIEMATNGASQSQLVESLIDNDIDQNEAFNYIEQLIDNQILISEISPTVTGDELHDFLIKKLKSLNIKDDNILNIISKVRTDINILDKAKPKEAIIKHKEISENLKKIDNEFDEKYLIQTDLVINTIKNTVSENLVKDLLSGLTVLNKLTNKFNETNIDKFKEAFYKRYEESEIPLTLALDIEAGIGYLQSYNGSSADKTPLVDDLVLPYKTSTYQSYKLNWDNKQSLLLSKYLQSIKENKIEIEITDDEVKDFQENWDDLPSTISSMTKIIEDKGEFKIITNGAAGSSAINLLGRFAHIDNDLFNYIKEIEHKENELAPNLILAEVVHLPESRVGNILSRPVFRKYEIPYLAQSAVDREHQIPLDDLMISIKNNRIVLRSKTLDKEIKPHLSNAHNFSNNALPVYQFLADMQTQGLRSGVFFNWGFIEQEFNFLPRVTYKNIIFSLASWKIGADEIKEMSKISVDTKLMDYFNKFKEKNKIPNDVVLADGDNELYINLNSLVSIKMLISLVSKRPSFKLKEFLFLGKETIVKDNINNPFSNEMIFSFYKDVNTK